MPLSGFKNLNVEIDSKGILMNKFQMQIRAFHGVTY